MRKIIKIVYCCLALLTGLLFYEMVEVQAEEEANIKSNTVSDIVFIIDVSGSMKYTDVTNEVIDMVSIATDLCKENDRVAFVAFNDTIAYKYNFVDISDDNELSNYKKALSLIEYSNDTDIGLGLKEAVKMFADYGRDNSKKHIIFISDGEIDLKNSDTKRSEEESRQDVNNCIKTCVNNQIMIHSIGFIKGFSDSVDYLSVLSDSTGGIMNIVTSPFMLLDILTSIFMEIHDGASDRLDTYTSSEDIYSINIPVEKTLDEYRIIIYSSGDLVYLDVLSDNKKIKLVKEDNYAVIKIIEPIEENINITLEYNSGSNVTITGVEYFPEEQPITYAGYCEIKNEVKKNTVSKITFLLKDESNDEVIIPKSFYENINIDIVIINKKNNQMNVIQGQANMNGITFENIFRESGRYDIHVTYQMGDIRGECYSQIEVVNIPPKSIGGVEETLCIGNDSYIYDLSNLFENEDSDKLNYEIVGKTDAYIEAGINGESLIIRPVSYGESNFIVRAIDPEGASADAEISIHSLPSWKYHFKLTIGIVFFVIVFTTILIVLTIIIIYNKKYHQTRCFNGILIGNFINLKSKNNVGTLKWALSRIKEKEITLKDLLKEAKIDESLPDLDSIVFYCKKSNSMEVVHDSRNSIFVNSKNISRGELAEVIMGDTVYIGFYENAIELELVFLEE